MATGKYEYQTEYARKHVSRGLAQCLLDVLDVRRLPVSEELRARILDCTETLKLSAWVRKAATATRIDEVF